MEVTVTDPALAQTAYQGILSLPSFPAGALACPADLGVVYHLTFSGTDGVVARVALSPTGCQGADVTSGSSSATLWAAQSPEFWAGLSANLHVPESDIYPYPCVPPNKAAVCALPDAAPATGNLDGGDATEGIRD